MRCPDCHFEGTLIGNRCARCGYYYHLPGSRRAEMRAAPVVHAQNRIPIPVYPLQTGDVLCEGRYRLIKQIPLPGFHKREIAWMAAERASYRRVILRGAVLAQVVGTEGIDEEQISLSIIQRLSSLGNHAGLPHILHHFIERGIFFIAFHPMEGDSLEALLNQQQGTLPESIVASCSWHLCGILSLFAHQQPPYVHGSITTETILMSREGELVGLAHIPLLPLPQGTPANQDTTLVFYAAPEQARGSTTPSSDLYTVAAIMHHAVTGYHPIQRTKFFYPLARRLNPTVSPEMEMILAQQLRLAPSDRYISPVEMQRDLTILIKSHPRQHEEEQRMETPQFNVTQLDMGQVREWSKSSTLLDIGVLASVVVLLLVGLLFAVLRP